MQVDVTLMDQNMVSAAFTRFHKILKVGQAFYFVRCKAHWTMIWKKRSMRNQVQRDQIQFDCKALPVKCLQ